MNFGVRIKRETRLKRWRIEEGGGGGGNGGHGGSEGIQKRKSFSKKIFFGSFCLVFSSFHLLLPLVGSLVSLYCSFVFLLGGIPDSLWGSMSLFFFIVENEAKHSKKHTLSCFRWRMLCEWISALPGAQDEVHSRVGFHWSAHLPNLEGEPRKKEKKRK